MRVFARASTWIWRSLERYDSLITDLELTLVRTAKQHNADPFHRLRSVPGIGEVLALTILYRKQLGMAGCRHSAHAVRYPDRRA
jgi:hypothetical protein